MTMKTDTDRTRDADRLRALNDSLTNWTPNQNTRDVIEQLRDMARQLGENIIYACPDGRERSLALTHLEETVMWAVKSLVLPER